MRLCSLIINWSTVSIRCYLPQSSALETDKAPLPPLASSEREKTDEETLGFRAIRADYSLDQLMQIQLNILFQINICLTAFPLAITHRKSSLLSIVSIFLNPRCSSSFSANSEPNHPPTKTHRVFATSHREWMMKLLLLLPGWLEGKRMVAQHH